MTSDEHQELSVMLDELESYRLGVALVPCRWEVNYGGCIRVAVQRNTAWYRRFCAEHLSSRRRKNQAPDTRIRRRDTIAILSRLIRTGASRSGYVDEFIQIARQRIRRAQATAA